MTVKIVDLSTKTNRAEFATARGTLNDALAALDDEKTVFSRAKKILVIALDDTDKHNRYEFESFNCGMTTAEAVALLNVLSAYYEREILER